MAEKIKLLLFKLQLALSLLMFFSFLGTEYIKQFKIALFALVLLVLMGGLIALNLISSPHPVAQPPRLSPAIITTLPALEEMSLSEADVTTQIYSYEKLLVLQPTHRDLLINIALLYQAKMDEQRSSYYWQKALKQDPNSPLFVGTNFSYL